MPERQTATMNDPSFLAMAAEVEASSALYKPSRFWDSLNTVNAQWLGTFGLENFKRTVAQNYFNWMVAIPQDPQFRAAFARWIRRPTTRPLRTRMTRPDLLRTTIGLEDRLTPFRWLVYRTFVAMLWDLTSREDRLGLSDRLEEPGLGNPIEIVSRGKRISQDLANSIRECNTVWERCDAGRTPRPVVAELGAGYGRLGQVFLSGTPARYFIFDIPPALHVSQWYLGKLFPERKVFAFRHFDRFEDVRAEVEAADVAFFTPNQLPLLPERSVDVFLSISTLPEMALAQISNYLGLISRTARRGVYLKQWRKWFNDKDGYEFTYDRLVLPEDWRMVLDRPDAIQPLFQERAWVRPGA